MNYHVVKTSEGGREGRFKVQRVAPESSTSGAIKSFTPRQWHGFDLNHEARARAQAFCDRLNGGGIAREQALREAVP